MQGSQRGKSMAMTMMEPARVELDSVMGTVGERILDEVDILLAMSKYSARITRQGILHLLGECGLPLACLITPSLATRGTRTV